MAEQEDLGNLVPEYMQVPSDQMVMRRYKDPDMEYLRSFFTDGLYCRNLPEFKDDLEGILGEPAMNETLRDAVSPIDPEQRKVDKKRRLTREEYKEQLYKFHRNARKKLFINCWRLGTDEEKDIWEEYTEKAGKQGYALETTVGQFIDAIPAREVSTELDPNDQTSLEEIHETAIEDMHANGIGHDIALGTVWYQDRSKDTTEQPEDQEILLSYFKRQRYTNEKEMRLVLNPFDGRIDTLHTKSGGLTTQVPDIEQDYRHFGIDTKEMVNRLVISPNADSELKDDIKDVLDDLNVTYKEGSDQDLEIVESHRCGAPLHETRSYSAEFWGNDNYGGSVEDLNECQNEFIQRTNTQHWPVVDIVTLSSTDADPVGEGYRYTSENPDIDPSDYGHSEFQAVRVMRLPGKLDWSDYFSNSETNENDLDISTFKINRSQIFVLFHK